MSRQKYMKMGCILFIGAVLIGVSPTVIEMLSTFNAVEEGSVSSTELAQSISSALTWTAWCLPFAFLGVCLWLVGWFKKPGISS